MKHDKYINLLLIILTVTFILMMIASVCLVVCMVRSIENDTSVDTPDTLTNDYNKVEPYYHVTAEERELLARIVSCEGSICSFECQKDICSVIFNRLESGKWTRDMNNDDRITIYDIVYYPNAFTPTVDGSLARCVEPDVTTYAAVDAVIQDGPSVPEEVRYFRTSHDFNWSGYENYKVIDNVYFGYFQDWRNGAW